MSEEQNNDLLKNVLGVQQHVWAISLAIGILYGAGWLIQYIVLLRLGVGPILPTREASLASGATFFLFVMPILFNWGSGTNEKIGNAPHLWQRLQAFGGVFFLYTSYFLCLFTIVLQRSAKSADIWLLPKAMFYILVLNFSWRVGIGTLVKTKTKDPMTIYTLLILFLSYTSNVAPYLVPFAGGYTLSLVSINSTQASSEKTWLVVTSDSQTLVLADETNLERFWKSIAPEREDGPKITRLNWSEVKSVSSVSAKDIKSP